MSVDAGVDNGGLVLEKDPYGHRLTNGSDVELRYGGSIVLVNNNPHLVSYGDGRSGDWKKVALIPYSFKVKDFASNQHFIVDIINDFNLISTDFDLGWGEWPEETFGENFTTIYYIERIPTRRYKQGLTSNNTQILKPSFDKAGILNWDNSSSNHSFIGTLIASQLTKKKVNISKTCKSLFEYLNERNFRTVASNIGFILNSKVALVIPKYSQPVDFETFRLNVMVEQACIGTYQPSIESFQIAREGLYSVFEEDLTIAGLLKH